jgi:hypothetical protein
VQNRKALAAPLRVVSERLAALLELLEAGDIDALQAFFGAARDALACGATDARSGGASPEIHTAHGAASKE